MRRVERSMTSACTFKSKKLKKLNFCEVTAASQLSKNFIILERPFFYSHLKYFSEKNARVSITASDVTQNIISESEPHIYR